MKSFLSRFQALVLFVLSGFDRLRFCGESRLLNHAGGVNSYAVGTLSALEAWSPNASARLASTS